MGLTIGLGLLASTLLVAPVAMPHGMPQKSHAVLQLMDDGAQKKPGNARLEDITEVPDNRAPIKENTKFPFCTVCKLFITWKDGTKSQGSGTVVGPYHVLTAGHVLYRKSRGGWFSSIEIVPGYDGLASTPGEMRPFGTFDYQQSVVDGRWSSNEDTDYDIGVLLTSTRIGDKTGYMGFMSLEDRQLTNLDVHMAGYASDRDNAKRLCYNTAPISRVSDTRFYYKMATGEGESGAGVFKMELKSLLEAPKCWVVGIHTMGDRSENSATRLNDEWANRIIRWRKDDFSKETWAGGPPTPPKN